jgi:hypothetical protein
MRHQINDIASTTSHPRHRATSTSINIDLDQHRQGGNDDGDSTAR